MSGPALPREWVEPVSRQPGDGGPTGTDRVRTVPRLGPGALARWDLTVDGTPRSGGTALAVPVRRGKALDD